MRNEDIRKMAHDIIVKGSIENDFIEYKKSVVFKDKILKTACAFANNYMNREIGLLFIGIEEVNDVNTGEKAIPKRPISGINDRYYIVIAIEPGSAGPYQTSDKAENDKDILLKAGRYIRVKRDTRLLS